MIQRIQTLFLLLVVIGNVLLFFLPLGNIEDGSIQLYLTGFTQKINLPIYTTLPVIFLVVASAILSIIAIFSYKKRHFQINLCKINFLLTLLIIGYILFLLPDFIIPAYYSAESLNPSYSGFIPVFNMVLLMLAMKFIRNDIELVQSADRIR